MTSTKLAKQIHTLNCTNTVLPIKDYENLKGLIAEEDFLKIHNYVNYVKNITLPITHLYVQQVQFIKESKVEVATIFGGLHNFNASFEEISSLEEVI